MNKAEIEKEIEELEELKHFDNATEFRTNINEIEKLKSRLSQRIDDEKEFGLEIKKASEMLNRREEYINHLKDRLEGERNDLEVYNTGFKEGRTQSNKEEWESGYNKGAFDKTLEVKEKIERWWNFYGVALFLDKELYKSMEKAVRELISKLEDDEVEK